MCDPKHHGKSFLLEHNLSNALSFIATFDEVWKMLNNWQLTRMCSKELLYIVTGLEFKWWRNQEITLFAFSNVHVCVHTNTPHVHALTAEVQLFNNSQTALV